MSKRSAAVAVLSMLASGELSAQASRRAPRLDPIAGEELPRTYSGPPTRGAISAGDLMTRLYIVADDSMQGRDAFSEGNVRGTNYIAAELARMGLEPAGDDGYFQYPLVFRRTDSTTSTLAIGGAAYRLWRDFAPRDQGDGARAFDGLAAIYAGSLGDTARMLPSAATAGRVAVVTLARDEQGRRNTNVNRAQLTARFRDAAAIAIVYLDWAPPGELEQGFMAPQPGVRGMATTQVRPSYFYVTAAAGRAMMGGADPEQAQPGAAGVTVRGGVRFTESPAPGRNVIAILRGSDPVLRNQFVAIGAHNDHVGFSRRPADHDSVRAFMAIAAPQGADNAEPNPSADDWARIRALTDSLRARHGGPRPDSIYNGADDDGSGTVGLLEIAEAFATTRARPKRSILFIWHTGEEYGMLGARYFTDHPTVPRDSIVAQLNIDMIGRGRASDFTGVTSAGAAIRGGDGYLQLIGSRRLSRELGDLVETVNRERRLGLRFDYSLDANGHPQNIYCRSDHAMYARWGIPVVFFTTGGHADYHQLTDEPQYVDYRHLERVSTLIHQVGLRVANMDRRVVVDGARPDPNGACRQ
jgi:hypothetical protein